MKNKIFNYIFPVVLFLNSISAAQDFQIKLQELPTSTPKQITKWNETKDYLLGILAYDPEGNTPKDKTQKGTFGLLTPSKVNFSGTFNRYGTEGEKHGAYDWNFMIQPFDEYKWVYNLALESTYKDVSKWPGLIDYDIQQQIGCRQSDYTKFVPGIMAEISPFYRFLNDNIWFQKTTDHCKEGKYLKRTDTIAVYGCAVNDNNHGYNPEIHPAQQIWFRNKDKSNSNSQFYWLMFLQDASDRFGNWVSSPIYGQYKIAFKINANTFSPRDILYQPLTMNISVAKKYDLVTANYPPYSQDADDGNSHSLVLDGIKLLTVNEPQDENRFLGIKFVEITKLSDGSIIGYVQVSMVLGDYDTSEIGVCVLELEIKKASYLSRN